MSEQKLISPLLDGFAMGNPISDHNGIRCCPAIKENTDKKYIVKIVSIPASQVQMDALLLAGAYKDPSEAMDYFHAKGEDLIKEAELLKNLSKLEGFLAYDGWQMEPITRHRLGYEIYLISSYKRSLEKYIRHHAVTHLEAINLGLDMCSALSVCRQAGALYVDLKPSNIFMSDKKEYRIGDIGFIQMDALRYTALPERYQSSYTPPELYDPMSSVNMTVDTYALGMILYQLYNDGNLPFKGKAPEEALPAPVQADYELAEIILKAIDPDPDKRWDDPAEMGKALASYMQRNSVNDVAITPLRTKKRKAKKEKKSASPVSEPAVDAPFEAVDSAPAEEAANQTAPLIEQELPDLETSPEPEDILEDLSDAVTEVLAEDKIEPEPMGDPEEPQTVPAVVTEESEAVENAEEEIPEESPSEDEDSSDFENPAEPEESPVPLSEELSRIFAKADDLLAHEAPEGVHFPDTPEEEDPFAFVLDEEDEVDETDIPYDPLMEDEGAPDKKHSGRREKKFADPKYKRRKKRFFSTVFTVLVLILIGLGAFWYYRNIFLQTIDAISITGNRSQISVQVDTKIDESLLTVSCLDNYGNTKTASLQNGKAEFTGLQPNTMYTIQLDIEGFHSLVGKTSDIFTTDATTSIISFTSVAGAEDGSVMLNFTVDGDEPEHWAVTYHADGEEEIRKTFTGHSVTIEGLALGKMYTFTLDAGENRSLSGEKTLELMASRLILAENLSVTSANGSEITVCWDAPGDIVVESWDVRCYNDRGYDQQVTVLDTEVMFTGIDPSVEYTIEVTAAGMTRPARTGITANPISIHALNVDESAADKLTLTWDAGDRQPEDGWLVMYTVDGGESNVVKTTKTTADVAPKIPGGKYIFTIQSADGTSVFNSVHTFTVSEGQPFEANALSADMLTIDLLKTPADSDWYFENISTDQLTTQFAVGDGISIVLRSSDSFYLPGYQTKILYVIRDTYGNVLSANVHEETIPWKNIWMGGDSKNGELNVPSVPTYAGEYVLHLYFDGMSVAELPFSISN